MWKQELLICLCISNVIIVSRLQLVLINVSWMDENEWQNLDCVTYKLFKVSLALFIWKVTCCVHMKGRKGGREKKKYLWSTYLLLKYLQQSELDQAKIKSQALHTSVLREWEGPRVHVSRKPSWTLKWDSISGTLLRSSGVACDVYLIH